MDGEVTTLAEDTTSTDGLLTTAWSDWSTRVEVWWLAADAGAALLLAADFTLASLGAVGGE